MSRADVIRALKGTGFTVIPEADQNE